MLIKTFGSAVYGIKATTITIEVSATQGINFFLVGLPDSAVKESQQRIESALQTYGYRMPGKKVVINMAPADIRKEGSAYDLPLAIGILAASEQMKTLQCDFVQKKTISILADELLSEGKLSFKQADKLCWEYVKPYQYRFTMNGGKVMIASEDNKNIIDVNSSKIFKEISQIIISGINGSGIFDERKFAAKFNAGTNDYQVVLTPKQRDLRQMFNSITLIFDKSDYTVNSVEIKESSDDTTFIVMKNKQINKELSDEIFVIR
jgi:outer membrane lipoprotein-sorting protein